MELGLSGKTALVTGSHKGTGAEIALRLACEGVDVFVHGFTPTDAEETVSRIADAGGKAWNVFGDITTDKGASLLAQQIDATAQPPNILINNYGAASRDRWDNLEPDRWIESYETNVLSSMRIINRFSSVLVEQGWGRIIQLGTIGITSPGNRMPGYYAAKAALGAATISLAKELKDTGVAVNMVSPGLIRTQQVEDHYLALAKKNDWGDTWDEIEPRVIKSFMDNLTGYVTRTEEVADLVLFLASERASSITAQNIRIDGGALAILG